MKGFGLRVGDHSSLQLVGFISVTSLVALITIRM